MPQSEMYECIDASGAPGACSCNDLARPISWASCSEYGREKTLVVVLRVFKNVPSMQKSGKKLPQTFTMSPIPEVIDDGM